MFFSQVRLKPDAGERRSFWRLIKDGYETHALIWDLFGDDPDRNRDFLYRVESGGALPSFLVVSVREPENRYDVWNIGTKEYSPVIHTGQRLSFMLRTNPVRKKRDAEKKQHRHDVVMETKTRLKEEGVVREKWPSEGEIVQKAGYAWLATRAELYGFLIDEQEVRVDGYFQHQLIKPKGGHMVRFSTVDFNGFLTVTDPERFIQGLFEGIGPSKGFGCGLLLVKPVYGS